MSTQLISNLINDYDIQTDEIINYEYTGNIIDNELALMQNFDLLLNESSKYLISINADNYQTASIDRINLAFDNDPFFSNLNNIYNSNFVILINSDLNRANDKLNLILNVFLLENTINFSNRLLRYYNSFIINARGIVNYDLPDNRINYNQNDSTAKIIDYYPNELSKKIILNYFIDINKKFLLFEDYLFLRKNDDNDLELNKEFIENEYITPDNEILKTNFDNQIQLLSFNNNSSNSFFRSLLYPIYFNELSLINNIIETETVNSIIDNGDNLLVSSNLSLYTLTKLNNEFIKLNDLPFNNILKISKLSNYILFLTYSDTTEEIRTEHNFRLFDLETHSVVNEVDFNFSAMDNIDFTIHNNVIYIISDQGFSIIDLGDDLNTNILNETGRYDNNEIKGKNIFVDIDNLIYILNTSNELEIRNINSIDIMINTIEDVRKFYIYDNFILTFNDNNLKVYDKENLKLYQSEDLDRQLDNIIIENNKIYFNESNVIYSYELEKLKIDNNNLTNFLSFPNNEVINFYYRKLPYVPIINILENRGDELKNRKINKSLLSENFIINTQNNLIKNKKYYFGFYKIRSII